MTIFGVDLHPQYQAGISIPGIHSEGFAFVICKLSEGTNSASYAGSRGWINEARGLGMHAGGYHYLRAGDEVAQADVFCDALQACGNPAGMLDVEAGSGGIDGVHAFLDRCNQRGHPIQLLYMPRWYWQQIGQPNLAGLPPLWSSRYPSMTADLASALYGQVPGTYWNGYGGGGVAVLQFTSTARVAGYTVDANAFEGTPDQLAALFGGAPAAPTPAAPPPPTPRQLGEDHAMHVYSPEPADSKQAKQDWPTRTVTFGFDPVGGWGGNMVVHAQWGSRGGWIHAAQWWVRDPHQWSPNTPIHYPVPHPIGANGSERWIGYGWITPPPAGADCLELTFSAPDGLHIFPFYER